MRMKINTEHFFQARDIIYHQNMRYIKDEGSYLIIMRYNCPIKYNCL